MKYKKNLLILSCIIITTTITNLNKVYRNFNNYQLKDKYVTQLYKLVEEVHNILVEENISYLIQGGTLLGSVRHGGLIPWDDDVDFFIFENDLKKLRKILPTFRKMGFFVVDKGYIIKIYFEKGKYAKIKINREKEMEYVPNSPMIDIFVLKYYESKKKYHYSLSKCIKKWPNGYLLRDEIFPINKNYKYGNLLLHGPKNCDDYLKRHLGKDWKTVGYINSRHIRISNYKVTKKELFFVKLLNIMIYYNIAKSPKTKITDFKPLLPETKKKKD